MGGWISWGHGEQEAGDRRTSENTRALLGERFVIDTVKRRSRGRRKAKGKKQRGIAGRVFHLVKGLESSG